MANFATEQFYLPCGKQYVTESLAHNIMMGKAHHFCIANTPFFTFFVFVSHVYVEQYLLLITINSIEFNKKLLTFAYIICIMLPGEHINNIIQSI